MDRRELIDNLSAQLEQLDAKIDELESKAEKADAGTQQEHDMQIKNLRNKMTLAQEKMKEMKDSGDEDWNELREGAENAMDEVDSAIKSAISRFQ
jgi:chromosome segregation ATPase